MNEALTWLGIAICITQSATCSGLNLAVFTPSRLRIEAAAEEDDPDAAKVLALRRNTNFTLVTILWGNMAINVLLTLLAESLMAGLAAFLFSTVVITFVGEIIPQAYFSRHALWVAARLEPLLRLYQLLLWPIAMPIGKLLDLWVGPEGIPWYREAELRDVLTHHARHEKTEVSRLEATGAINFLALDDVLVGDEGEPRLVLDADAFLRGALFAGEKFTPLAFCHRPLIVRDSQQALGQVLGQLTIRPELLGDDVIDEDLILVWTPAERRIITGADLLGRLLRGITRVL